MQLVFLCMSDNFIMKCPMCLIDTKYIIQNINKSKSCKIPGSLNSFKDQFGQYKENHKNMIKKGKK